MPLGLLETQISIKYKDFQIQEMLKTIIVNIILLLLLLLLSLSFKLSRTIIIYYNMRMNIDSQC